MSRVMQTQSDIEITSLDTPPVPCPDSTVAEPIKIQVREDDVKEEEEYSGGASIL